MTTTPHPVRQGRRALMLAALAILVPPQPLVADPYRNKSGKPRSESQRREAIEERRRAHLEARREYEREAGKLAEERSREIDKASEEYWREVEQAEREYDRDLAEGTDPDAAFEKYAEKIEKIDATYHEKVWERRAGHP